MLSDEEYRKELARYFDSIRDKESPHMGEEHSCLGAHSELCMFHSKGDCFSGCNNGIYDAVKNVELVEEWSKNNPVISVADKFRNAMEELGIKYKNCANEIPASGCALFEHCDD